MVSSHPVRSISNVLAGALIAAVLPATSWAQSFLDRTPSSLRVANWNILDDSPFGSSTTRRDAFDRVIVAVDADVWAFQELYTTSSATLVARFNLLLPLGPGLSWNVYKSGENAIVSRFPLSLTRSGLAANRAVGALIDLPNADFMTDFYLVGTHLSCCGSGESSRRQQADSLASFFRDARTAGGSITLPAATAFGVIGDLNIVSGSTPLDALIAGNFYDNTTYGADEPPDWDGTNLNNTLPIQNASSGLTWTWRDDNSGFAPGILDFQIITDSVLAQHGGFILNTAALSASALAAAGLNAADSPFSLATGRYDHLPVVVDYLAVPEANPLALLIAAACSMPRLRRGVGRRKIGVTKACHSAAPSEKESL